MRADGAWRRVFGGPFGFAAQLVGRQREAGGFRHFHAVVIGGDAASADAGGGAGNSGAHKPDAGPGVGHLGVGCAGFRCDFVGFWVCGAGAFGEQFAFCAGQLRQFGQKACVPFAQVANDFAGGAGAGVGAADNPGEEYFEVVGKVVRESADGCDAAVFASGCGKAGPAVVVGPVAGDCGVEDVDDVQGVAAGSAAGREHVDFEAFDGVGDCGIDADSADDDFAFGGDRNGFGAEHQVVQAAFVGVGECCGDFADDGCCLVDREGSAREHFRQRGAAGAFAHDVHEVVLHADICDGGDARISQQGGAVGGAEEAGRGVFMGGVDDDGGVEDSVEAEVDLACFRVVGKPGSEHFRYDVAVGDDCAAVCACQLSHLPCVLWFLILTAIV